MILKENAGGDKDLFSVERKMQKQKHKLEQQRQKEYLREKQKEKNNVFNFMNATLGDKSKNIVFVSLYLLLVHYLDCIIYVK